jgi:DNA-binding transcriptional LysR family regulator
LTDLTNEPYILFKRESGQVFYDYVISFYQRNGLRLNIRHEADHPSTVLGLVAAGLGITILPFTSTHAIPGVVCCDLPAASPQLEIALTWRPQNESTLLANFTETIRNYRLLEENVSGREGTGLERLKAG